MSQDRSWLGIYNEKRVKNNRQRTTPLPRFWARPWIRYLGIAECTFPLFSPWAHGWDTLLPALSPSSSPPLPSPYPISPFAAARECVCPLPLVFGPSSVVSLLCFALLPVLPCAVCFSACQGWVTVCFLLPPLKFSFLCSACLLCAPLPVSCLRCLSSYFPVAGCGRLSLSPPSFPSPRLCVCEAPNKTRHLSSDSTSPDQCLVFCTTDFTDSLDILVR